MSFFYYFVNMSKKDEKKISDLISSGMGIVFKNKKFKLLLPFF